MTTTGSSYRIFYEVYSSQRVLSVDSRLGRDSRVPGLWRPLAAPFVMEAKKEDKEGMYKTAKSERKVKVTWLHCTQETPSVLNQRSPILPIKGGGLRYTLQKYTAIHLLLRVRTASRSGN